MILTDRLKGIIVSRGLTQKEVAEKIGMTPKTFYLKMKIGVFDSDEIEKLDIEDPGYIFLALSNLKRYK